MWEMIAASSLKVPRVTGERFQEAVEQIKAAGRSKPRVGRDL
jgi:beta-lactam-binding protein with PASTA domain